MKTPVQVRHPLQQGLRLCTSHLSITARLRVQVRHPLQQGLRLTHDRLYLNSVEAQVRHPLQQ